ncbi:MAG TPA: PAS domain S-box protein [Catalimonadaceae bacterium]|nr:PAS domain S-box protein [Catalimonadaceae bacterium]
MKTVSNRSFAPDEIAKALLSNTLQVVFLLDEQFHIRAFNEQARLNMQMLRGRPLEEGEHFFGFVQPDQLEIVERELKAALAGHVISGTKKLVNKDGKSIFTRYNYNPVREDNGKVFALCLSYQDLTPDVHAKEDAEKSSLLLDLIFQQNHDGLLVVHLENLQFKANPEFLRIFGLTDDSLKEEISRLTNPGKWDDTFPFTIKHAFSLPVRQDVELQILKSGGEETFARIVRNELVHPNGSKVLLISVKDVTEMVQMERQRIENELRFKTIARNFPNGNITVLDKNLNVVFTDGVDYETDLNLFVPKAGQSILNQYGKNYAEYMKESLIAAFNGVSEQFELRFGTKTYSIVVAPLPDPTGEVTRVMKIAQNVSDEKNAQLDAHYRREYLRQILDIDPNFIYVVNKEGKVILANKSIAQFFDTTVSDFQENSENYFKTYKWRYEDVQDIDAQIFTNLKTITIEEAFFHKESKKMHLFQVTRTPFVSHGNEMSILCVGVDITDRVNAENELITQREYLRHILDTDPSLIFVKDAKGRFILVNRAFSEFYQCKTEDLLGKTDAELPWSEKERIHFENSDQAVINSNEPISSEEFVVNPITKKEAHFVTTKKPLLDAEGNPNILGVVTDITEQKKQEQQLRRSEFLLQQIFNKVADALFIIEAETLRIQDCNLKALDLIKASGKDKIVGEHIQKIQTVKEPGSRFWKNLFLNIQDDNPVVEAEMLNLANQNFWGSLAATSFTQEGKQLILLRISDVTSQKKSEEQIILALHEKEILIQEIHHRVKNNMAVISSLLQLQTGYIKDPGLIDVFRDSQSRIKSMALIHEKLYQSKTLAKVEMESYIKELTRTLFFTYNSRRIDLQISTKVENVFLDINSAVPCGLIINEVISNACKHAFVGKEKGLIEIRFEKKNDQYELEIKDDGIGMPPNMDLSNLKSLGMNLVQALSAQLGAQLEIRTQGGVCVKLAFVEKVKPSREQVRPD